MSARRSATPRLVAFDLGGVLYDVDPRRYAAALTAWLAVSSEQVAAATFASGLWQQVETGQVDGAGFLRQLCHRLGVAGNGAGLARMREAWCAILTLRPGATELVSRVRRRRCVWSNSDPVHAARIAADAALGLQIDHWVYSFAVGVEKPGGHFFQQAVQRAGLAPWQIVYVDDRPDNVAAARAQGIDGFVASSLAGVASGLAARGLLAR